MFLSRKMRKYLCPNAFLWLFYVVENALKELRKNKVQNRFLVRQPKFLRTMFILDVHILLSDNLYLFNSNSDQ